MSAQNVTFCRRAGAVQQCYGYSTLGWSSPSGAAPILGWHTFTRTGGNDWHIVRIPMGYFVRRSTASKWSALLTFGSSTNWAIPSFVNFYNRVWWCDGIGIWSWDGFGSVKPHVGSTAGRRAWPPWGSQLIAKHFERLFVAGFYGAPGRIVYSEVGATSPTWSTANTVTFSTTRTFNIDRQEPDDGIVALLPQFGQVSNLLIFKRKSVWTLAGNEQATFDLDMLSFDAGCLASRAVCNAPDGAYWLDHGKLLRFNGVDKLTSVSGRIQGELEDRTVVSRGYRGYNYFTHSLAAVDATRFSYGNVNQWSAKVVGTRNCLMHASGHATSAYFGITRSVPCPNYSFKIATRIPKDSTKHPRWFIFMRASAPVTAKRSPCYYLTYGNGSAHAYGTVFTSCSFAFGWFSAAGANATKLNSVTFAGAHNEWGSVVANWNENYIWAQLTFSGTNSARALSYRHTTTTALMDPRSTMFFGVAATTSTNMKNSGTMFDNLSVWFWRNNSYNQVAWSPQDNTIHVVTASADSATSHNVPLVYEIDTGEWTTRTYFPRCYNSSYKDALGRTFLGVQTIGNVAATGRFFKMDDTLNFGSGANTNCLYITNWLQGPTADLEQWLTEVHVHHQQKAGRKMQLFMSGKNNPWGDQGPTYYASYPMNDPQIRVGVNVPSQYTRLTMATYTTSADSFDLSRIRLLYDVTGGKARWRER